MSIALDLDQPDLFGGCEPGRDTERRRRLGDALTCLRDEVPDALQVVVGLAYWRERDNRSAHAGERWAYCVCRAGVLHEPADRWWRTEIDGRRGWDRLPAEITTWDELSEVFGDDPRRAEVAAWAGSLTAVDRWQDLSRPFELWTKPEQWHPDYIRCDHERPGWDQRIAAWRMVLAILDDAAGLVA